MSDRLGQRQEAALRRRSIYSNTGFPMGFRTSVDGETFTASSVPCTTRLVWEALSVLKYMRTYNTRICMYERMYMHVFVRIRWITFRLGR